MFHCEVKTVSRSAGRSSTAAAAYRSGEMIHDERTGLTFDYSRRSGIDNTLLIGWEGSRAELWNAAENSEKRKNACVAREVIISLPCEWSASERMAGVYKFAEYLRNTYGSAVDCAIHAPGKQGDQRNWHAHVLMTTRVVKDGEFLEKTRILDDKKTGPGEVIKIRTKLSEILSEGSQDPELWSHESHAKRGIERKPGKHIGVVRTSMKRKGYGDPRNRNKKMPSPGRARTQNEQLDEAKRHSGSSDRTAELNIGRAESPVRTSPNASENTEGREREFVKGEPITSTVVGDRRERKRRIDRSERAFFDTAERIGRAIRIAEWQNEELARLLVKAMRAGYRALSTERKKPTGEDRKGYFEQAWEKIEKPSKKKPNNWW